MNDYTPYLLEARTKQVNELQKENDKLKERVACLERSNDRREDTIYGLRDDVVDLDIIIHKAIEILENDKSSASFNTAERIVLDILKEADNE